MNTATAPARRNLNTLLERVENARDQLAPFVPKGQSVDEFIANGKRVIVENPEIAECTTVSVLRSLSHGASSGLPMDGRFSSLIVRKLKNGQKIVVFDLTYRGMISVAMASGFVTDVQSFAVTENDEFSVELGTEPKINHIPALLKGGKVIAAYAFARLRSGRLVIEVLGRADLDKIKKSSPAGERGPWGQWESQMARKSAIRRLLKKLPAAPFQNVLEASAEPYAMSATLVGPSTEHPQIEPPAGQATLPEDEHVLECRALERLRDASGEAELEAAWAQCQVEYSQAGLQIPGAVSNGYQELRDMQIDPGEDEWLRDYDNAPG